MDKIDIKKFKKYVEYLKNDYNREYWGGNVYMVE